MSIRLDVDPHGLVQDVSKFVSGKQILVVLKTDAVDAINYGKMNPGEEFKSLKMWVLNRIFILARGQSADSWDTYYGSFEGVFSEPELRKNKKGELYRQPIYQLEGEKSGKKVYDKPEDGTD